MFLQVENFDKFGEFCDSDTRFENPLNHANQSPSKGPPCEEGSTTLKYHKHKSEIGHTCLHAFWFSLSCNIFYFNSNFLGPLNIKKIIRHGERSIIFIISWQWGGVFSTIIAQWGFTRCRLVRMKGLVIKNCVNPNPSLN